MKPLSIPQAVLSFVISLALLAASPRPAGAAETTRPPRPAGTAAPAATDVPLGTTGLGHVYHFEYLRARPGRTRDYDRFVRSTFRPMLEEMVRRGIWLHYTFMAVPYAGPAPCADYTHVFIAELPNFAALDREEPTWTEIQKKLHPDEKERHQLFEVELPGIREMVREEILKDFEWK